MPFCGSCGKQYDDELKFCPHCGAPNALQKENYDQPVQDHDFKTVKRDGGPYGAYRLEDLPEGFVIDDRYEVKAKVGQGGFGAVYRAYDRNMDVDKALKIIPDSVAADKEAMADLQKEARIMISLNHPNIVRVYDFRDSGPIKYIDMEYVEGKPLNELKMDYPDKRMPEDIVKDLGGKIAAGLEFAHKKNIIHKDIKPQNIIVTESGEAKITDFGISESVRTSMSRLSNSSSSGTLVYMSPEQLKGERIGKEADIYSFGATMYELLSGHPPFYQGALEYQILNKAAEPIEGVSDEMNAIVLKCLEKDWGVRYSEFSILSLELSGKKKASKNEEGKSINEFQPKNDAAIQSISAVYSWQNERKKGKSKGQKSKVKKFFTGLLIFIGIIVAIFSVLVVLFANFPISESQYSADDVKLWGYWDQGEITGIELTITNNSIVNVRHIEGRVDIFNKTSNRVINGATFESSRIDIPPNGARNITIAVPIRGLPNKNEWTWSYSLKLKGCILK